MDETLKSCIEQAERFLVLREHNRSELVQKLKNKGFDIVIINQTIDFLIKTDELNEERYIRAFIRSNNRRHPEGKNVVFQRLLQKDAEKNLSKMILDEIYSEEYEQTLLDEAAENVLRKSHDKAENLLLCKMVKSGFKLSDSKKTLQIKQNKEPKTEC